MLDDIDLETVDAVGYPPPPGQVPGIASGGGQTQDLLDAKRHALQVRRFWASAGWDVRTWAQWFPGTGGRPGCWGVGSDLVNGMPRRRLETA